MFVIALWVALQASGGVKQDLGADSAASCNYGILKYTITYYGIVWYTKNIIVYYSMHRMKKC